MDPPANKLAKFLLKSLIFPSITKAYNKKRDKLNEKKRKSKYGKYLDEEYIALLLFKLDAYKSEIAMKEMQKIDVVDMRKSGRRR